MTSGSCHPQPRDAAARGVGRSENVQQRCMAASDPEVARAGKGDWHPSVPKCKPTPLVSVILVLKIPVKPERAMNLSCTS